MLAYHGLTWQVTLSQKPPELAILETVLDTAFHIWELRELLGKWGKTSVRTEEDGGELLTKSHAVYYLPDIWSLYIIARLNKKLNGAESIICEISSCMLAR